MTSIKDVLRNFFLGKEIFENFNPVKTYHKILSGIFLAIGAGINIYMFIDVYFTRTIIEMIYGIFLEYDGIFPIRFYVLPFALIWMLCAVAPVALGVILLTYYRYSEMYKNILWSIRFTLAFFVGYPLIKIFCFILFAPVLEFFHFNVR